jgi:hypothetical protein
MKLGGLRMLIGMIAIFSAADLTAGGIAGGASYSRAGGQE